MTKQATIQATSKLTSVHFYFRNILMITEPQFCKWRSKAGLVFGVRPVKVNAAVRSLQDNLKKQEETRDPCWLFKVSSE